MMTLLTYGASKENDRPTVDLTQPIAITKSVERNKTTFYAYLPNNHRATICRHWSATGKIYSGLLRREHPNKLYSIPVLGIDGLMALEKKKSNNPETFVACLIGPVKSKKLFRLYQRLFDLS